jgi:hypothetical protein
MNMPRVHTRSCDPHSSQCGMHVWLAAHFRQINMLCTTHAQDLGCCALQVGGYQLGNAHAASSR